MPLTDRASLLRAFFRLLDTDADDPALGEHDDSTLEGAYLLLEAGLEDAQDWMIQQGLADRWVSTVDMPDHGGSGADSDWQGTDSTDGGRYAALPADFFRLAGDETESALREPDGTRWGKLVDWEFRRRVTGNYYWLQNENLWIAPSASPPSNLQMDYHHRIADLADGTTVDFPAADRPLIVAYAADRAIDEAWAPDTPGLEGRVRRRLMKCQRRAYKRGRRSRQPRQLRVRRTQGSHWFTR